MRQIRRADQRGHADHGWLDARHTFSFSDYYDPAHMGFRDLRVINEDRIAGGTGFGSHPHREMEILTYVLEGQLRHGDSMGHSEILHAGEWQQLSAGTGMYHSEQNADPRQQVHLYQIWITPSQRGLPPTYGQRRFDGPGKLLIASPDGADGSFAIRQDARVYLARLSPGESLTHPLATSRHAWLQVVRGPVRVGDDVLQTSDAVAVSGEPTVTLSAHDEAEVILFDLP